MDDLHTLVDGRCRHAALVALLGPGVIKWKVASVGQTQFCCIDRHIGAGQWQQWAKAQRRGGALLVNDGRIEFALRILIHNFVVGINSQQHGSRGQAVVPAVAQHVGGSRPDGWGQGFETPGEMLGHQMHQHAFVNDRVIVAVPTVAAGALGSALQQIGPSRLQQFLCHAVLLEQLIASGQVHRTQVVAPTRWPIAPGFTDIGQGAGQQDALARQQVNRLRAGTPVVLTRVAAAQPALQIGIGFLQHIWRYGKLAVARFYQQMQGVNGRERVAGVARPQCKAAICGLPRTQLREVALQGRLG